MSRVLLISTNRATAPYVVYPLGMAVVAGALDKNGHQVEQFDLLAAETSGRTLESIILEFGPDFICLSLRNIDNTDSFSGADGWYLEEARQTVIKIRSLTTVPLIVGGPAFSLMPEAILDYLKADYGIIGEGEEALPQLLNQLSAGNSPPALIKGTCPLNGEEFATPQFHPELLSYYQERSGIANLQSKRGCPHRCCYCTYPELEGRTFRRRPATAVVDDIERLQKDHGIKNLFFVDSVFNESQGHHLAVSEEILRREINIKWCAFFRPTGLNRKDLKLMQKAGLFALELGSDATTDTTLQGLNKSFSFADIRSTHEACLSLNLPAAHYIIFGGPEESPKTLHDGLANLDQLTDSVIFAFSGLRILPGTQLYQRALQDNVISKTTSLLRPTYYFSPQIDPTTMNETISKACRGHRERLFPPAEALERMTIMRRFGFKGLLWDQLIKQGKKQ
ncbi:MAG: lipid biosynthesis B12-binding/radical SAM protein [Pseudomonadota bacterium]|nr:lipid biosynthesis B12-binding/radical SAM protein [Pseudomonadota bacterium]